MKHYCATVLGACLALCLARPGLSQSVAINELMYHPLQPALGAEPLGEEYVELFNYGATSVDLTGWRFSKGGNFTFGSVSLAAVSYIGVCQKKAAFNTKSSGVSKGVGQWFR